MIIKIWDFLFTRKVYTLIEKVNYYDNPNNKYDHAQQITYVLQDQFGNIKKTTITLRDYS
jgi:hypothetical protein